MYTAYDSVVLATVERNRYPPGFTSLVQFSINTFGFSTKSTTSEQQTKSNTSYLTSSTLPTLYTSLFFTSSPCFSLCLLPISINFSAGSTPTTCPSPNLAKDSERMPAPHPISTTFSLLKARPSFFRTLLR